MAPGRYIVWQYGTRSPQVPQGAPRFSIGDIVTVEDCHLDEDGEVFAIGNNGIKAFVLASALGELPPPVEEVTVEGDGRDDLPDYADLPLAYALGLVRYLTENTPR